MPEEPRLDNPAKRLHTILTKALKDQDKGTIKDGWSRVFGLEKPDPVLIIQLIGFMLRSIEEIRVALQGVPNVNYELYTKCLRKILDAFSQVNLNADWRSYRQKFTPDALHGLEFISDVLDKSHAERSVSQESLDQFRGDLEELYAEIKEADLANDIKTFLLRNIASLLFAIRNYEVFGPAGLRDVLSQCYGSVYLEQETVSANAKPAKSHLEKFGKIVKAIRSILVLIRDGKELVATTLPPLLTEFANK